MATPKPPPPAQPAPLGAGGPLLEGEESEELPRGSARDLIAAMPPRAAPTPPPSRVATMSEDEASDPGSNERLVTTPEQGFRHAGEDEATFRIGRQELFEMEARVQAEKIGRLPTSPLPPSAARLPTTPLAEAEPPTEAARSSDAASSAASTPAPSHALPAWGWFVVGLLVGVGVMLALDVMQGLRG